MRFAILVCLSMLFVVCSSLRSNESTPSRPRRRPSFREAVVEGSRSLMSSLRNSWSSTRGAFGRSNSRASSTRSDGSRRQSDEQESAGRRRTRIMSSDIFEDVQTFALSPPRSSPRRRSRWPTVANRLANHRGSGLNDGGYQPRPSEQREDLSTEVRIERWQDFVMTIEYRPTRDSRDVAFMMVDRMLSDDVELPVVLLEEMLTDSNTGTPFRRMIFARRSAVGNLSSPPIRGIPGLLEALQRAQHDSGSFNQPFNQPSAPNQIEIDPNDEPVTDSDADIGVSKACCVCMERRKNTKLKPCGHEFCMSCTKKMDAQATTQKPFKCPSCRCKVENWCLNPKSNPKQNETAELRP